jgi:phage/plasmid-like protein (TIGR03299 family)
MEKHMHALEIGSAGQVAFATRGEPAWHLLGEVFPSDTEVSTAQMLRKAHLNDWNVRLVPAVQYMGRDNSGSPVTLPVPGKNVVLRDNPFNRKQTDALAVVGDRYHEVQNEVVFGWADNILDGAGQWETAGSIQEGRRVFGSLTIDRDVVVDPKGAADTTKTYLIVAGSHDGTLPTTAFVTPTRVVCQNTLTFALRGAKQTFKIRHTASFDERLAQAREALNITFKYMDVFEAEAQRLYEQSVTDNAFTKIITGLYPKPDEDKKGAFTRWENKVDLIQSIWKGNADTIVETAPDTMSGITGTGWGALNALTEYVDWYRTGRGENAATSLAESASGFVPATQTEKQRIRQAVLAAL